MLASTSVAILVASCAGQTASQVITDVGLVASGLSVAIASIQQVPGVASTTLTRLQADLTTIQTNAAQIAKAPAASTVQEIGQAVQDVAAVALPLVPGGSAIEVTIDAAVSLLPAILAAAGISGAIGNPAPAKYPPEQARLILAAAH
jgi:hypothetical protein